MVDGRALVPAPKIDAFGRRGDLRLNQNSVLSPDQSVGITVAIDSANVNVPEPASATLLVIGGIVIVWNLRRRSVPC